jgi:hypothetical protein
MMGAYGPADYEPPRTMKAWFDLLHRSLSGVDIPEGSSGEAQSMAGRLAPRRKYFPFSQEPAVESLAGRGSPC